MQQRSIPPFLIELVMDFGDTKRSHGADLYFFNKRSRRKLKKSLGPKIYARIKDQLDIYVVENGGQIITAAPRIKRIKR